MKVIQSMSENFESWASKAYLIVFHMRWEQDEDYCKKWLRAQVKVKIMRRDIAIKLLSPVAKVREHDLVMSCLEFHTKDCASIILGSGTANTDLLAAADNLREFQHGNKKFYLANPSKVFLESRIEETR